MIVAVDTGGTKTLITGFNKKGEPTEILRFPTPADKNTYVALLRDTLQKQYKNQVVDALVIALPATIRDNIAVWCQNLGWENFDIKHELRNVLGSTPIFIENDANLAGLAETRTLKPIPTSSLYITISTGIGTGITTNGQIDPGLRKSEGGLMFIEYDGALRQWESFASGRAIYRTYGKFARDIKDKHVWKEVADRVSRGLLVIIPLIQPDIIIIGGSIGTYFEQYNTYLKQLLEEKLPSHIPCPLLHKAVHPEQAVIYGCYYYGIDTITHK
jgi:predicted NBD/HSP70 family sugar kinase